MLCFSLSMNRKCKTLLSVSRKIKVLKAGRPYETDAAFSAFSSPPRRRAQHAERANENLGTLLRLSKDQSFHPWTGPHRETVVTGAFDRIGRFLKTRDLMTRDAACSAFSSPPGGGHSTRSGQAKSRNASPSLPRSEFSRREPYDERRRVLSFSSRPPVAGAAPGASKRKSRNAPPFLARSEFSRRQTL